MKKILIVSFILCCVNLSCYAEKTPQPYSKNEVVLNLNEPSVTETQKGKAEEDSLHLEYKTDLREKEHNIMLHEDVNRLQPEKKEVSKTLDKSITENTSVGATYKSTEKAGDMNDSVSVYSKYKKDKFSVTSAYSQDKEGYKQNGATGGTVSVAPEVSLNEHVSVKNVYSENISGNQQKNEVVLSVRPLKDDRVDLDLGAGQTFSTENQPAKSQINIGTKIRF